MCTQDLDSLGYISVADMQYGSNFNHVGVIGLKVTEHCEIMRNNVIRSSRSLKSPISVPIYASLISELC